MKTYYVAGIPYSDELFHHGIKGQKWGIRRYQNSDGTLTAEGQRRYGAGEVGIKNFQAAQAKRERVKSVAKKVAVGTAIVGAGVLSAVLLNNYGGAVRSAATNLGRAYISQLGLSSVSSKSKNFARNVALGYKALTSSGTLSAITDPNTSLIIGGQPTTISPYTGLYGYGSGKPRVIVKK